MTPAHSKAQRWRDWFPLQEECSPALKSNLSALSGNLSDSYEVPRWLPLDVLRDVDSWRSDPVEVIDNCALRFPSGARSTRFLLRAADTAFPGIRYLAHSHDATSHFIVPQHPRLTAEFKAAGTHSAVGMGAAAMFSAIMGLTNPIGSAHLRNRQHDDLTVWNLYMRDPVLPPEVRAINARKGPQIITRILEEHTARGQRP